MAKLTPKEKKEIYKFICLFPSKITVKVHHLDFGKYCAEIRNFAGCFTEADTFYELIEMVNDVVRTYFEVPPKYLPHMPEYLCPVRVAQRFKAYPANIQKGRVLNFQKIDEGTKC